MDPGFPLGGGSDPRGRRRQHKILPNFPKKEHEIEPYILATLLCRPVDKCPNAEI